MKMILAILGMMSISFPTWAADSTGNLDLSVGYISAPGSQSSLESDLSAANKNVKVSCTNVVTVHTGGTMGSATAGFCKFAGQDAVWACRNDMLGTTAKQDINDPTVSPGFNLTSLIANSCVGG